MSTNQLAELVTVGIGCALLLVAFVGTIIEHKLNAIIKLLEREK